MSPTNTAANRRSTTTTPATKPARQARGSAPNESYQLPVVGTTLPAGLVEKGFWGALVGSAVLGAVDPPLAALVGAGVLIARHRH